MSFIIAAIVAGAWNTVEWVSKGFLLAAGAYVFLLAIGEIN